MELQRYIGIELSNSKKAMAHAIEGLAQTEVNWQPAPGCNSIGLILFHMVRSEDSIMQGILQKKPSIWESERWYEQFGLPKEEDGSHYTADQVNAFKAPELANILALCDAVRAKTKEILRGMAIEAFDHIVTFPNIGDMPTAALFSFIVAHNYQHIGEIAYLRGMQRGTDK